MIQRIMYELQAKQKKVTRQMAGRRMPEPKASEGATKKVEAVLSMDGGMWLIKGGVFTIGLSIWGRASETMERTEYWDDYFARLQEGTL